MAAGSAATTPVRNRGDAPGRCEYGSAGFGDREEGCLRQEIPGVHLAIGFVHDLEMQMGAAAVAGGPHQPDDVPLVDGLAADKVDLAQVGVEGLPAVAVIDDDHQAA